MDRQQEFVLRTLEERDIRFVRLWFTDVLGTLKSVSVAPAELESAFEEGIGFDGSAIEGFARIFESDMVAMPDPTTFQVFPFEGGVSGESARMFCDILLPDGSPSWADPRHVLRRMLSKAAEKGFTFYTHPEIEFFLLENGPLDGSIPTPVDTGGYFEHTTHAVAVTSAGRPCSRWSGSASPSSSATTRSHPASRRSTCGTRTRSPPPTTS